MKFYHRTSAAAVDSILVDGFTDSTGSYMSSDFHTGVWLSNTPLNVNDGLPDGPLLLVELTLAENELDKYEWAEEHKPHREWLIPAAIINANSQITVIDVDDEASHEARHREKQ